MTARAPRVLLTIDVEEDMPSWKITNPTTTTNAAALPALQKLCNEIGIRPTYLCNYPPVTQRDSARIIKTLAKSGRCEIGAHLHPWNTPPYNGIPGRRVDETTVAYYMNDLGPALIRPKIATVTNAIANLVGMSPASFRAGRFGMDGPTLAVLPEFGYKVDTSVTPLAEHTKDGGPDFRMAPALPYHPSRIDICKPGDVPIVEIPVSIALTRKVPRSVQNAYIRIPQKIRLRGLLSKDFLNIVDFAWLYPVRFDLPEMIRAADTLVASGSPVLNIFYHSSELVPEMSGAVATQADADRGIARLRGILEYCIQRLGAVPMTLTEAGRECESWIATNSPTQIPHARSATHSKKILPRKS
ncbi:MAG: hypothetical protein ACKVS6_10905 [Planctomycetota bacterium]